MENTTKEPTLGEYGLSLESYDVYRNEKLELENELSQYREERSHESFIGGALVVGGIIFGIIFSSWIIFLAGLIVGTVISDTQIASKRKEDEELKKQKRKEISEKLESIKSKVSPFEEASIKYCEDYLKKFYHDNLYKKRSGTEKFEQALADFAAIIDAVKNETAEINKKLIFKRHTTPYFYENYLAGRQINHSLQKEKKQVFHAFDGVKIKSEDTSSDRNMSMNEELSGVQKNDRAHSSYVDNEPEFQIQNNPSGAGNAIAKALTESNNENVVPSYKKEVPPPVAPEKKYRTARKIDNWEEINKKRKITGTKGEEIALAIEQEYFESIGRNDLAVRVRHVSVEDGDGLGYDVLSFFDNGKEKYIEVKSTITSIESPFNISKNELGFLREHMDDAFICRVLVSEDAPNEAPEYEMIPSYVVLDHDISPTAFIVKPKKVQNHGTPQRSVWERIFVD